MKANVALLHQTAVFISLSAGGVFCSMPCHIGYNPVLMANGILNEMLRDPPQNRNFAKTPKAKAPATSQII